MHVGEKYKLYIPSELAYGEQSPTPAIPANSVLVFELELLQIKAASAEQ
jgi:FKBP-type peptidyl-prolyl cis-trans isomerase FklB